MTDIRLKQQFTLEAVTMDWLLRDNGALDEREELASAARVALGTDKMAGPDDVLPDPDSTDRRGWWGDLDAELIWDGWPIGTKNWLLLRAKIADAFDVEGATLARAQNYTSEALQPFIDKKIATSFTISATRNDVQTIEVDAKIYRGPINEIDLRYQQLWQEAPVFDAPVGNPVFIIVQAGQLVLLKYSPVMRERFLVPPQGNLALSGTVPTDFVGSTPFRQDLVLSPTAPVVRSKDFGFIIPQGNLVADRKKPGFGFRSGNVFLSPTAPIVKVGILAARRDLVLSPTAPVVRTLDHGIIVPQGNLALSVNKPFQFAPNSNLRLSTTAPIRTP